MLSTSFLVRANVMYLLMFCLTIPGESTSNFMRMTGQLVADQFPGHTHFCERNPEECGPTEASLPLTYGGSLWKLVEELNRRINNTVEEVSDQELYQLADFWTYPTGFTKLQGDCEDFALLKKRLLTLAGIPASNLLLTIVKLPRGEYHAVLTVRTTSGDFILDNLTDEILLYSNTDYRFLERQTLWHAAKWMTIRQ